jgi:pimeloyl-ACP methyl ester carboxylesterase
VGQKLSGKKEELVVIVKEAEGSTENFPGYSPGVEECWMEMDGARMRYLRIGSDIPLLAKAARNGAPRAGSLTAPASRSHEAPQPPLILLHGLLGYSFSWRYTMPALAPYASVYAPDLMGSGFSDRPAGIDHTVRGTARRVLRFIARLGITEFDLLGTSRGGAVAMMAAAECLREDSKSRLRRLVLVAPVNPYSAHGQRLAPFFGSVLGAAFFRGVIARTRFSYPYWHRRLYADRNRIPPEALAGYEAPLAKPGLFEHALSIASTWTKDLRELESVLPKLADVPTLLIWGREDPAVYASSAERLAQYFPKSRLLIFPGVGHLPYEECPQEFSRALIEFLVSESAFHG